MAGCQLSIVIPCRDYGQYLTEAVESVLRQESAVSHLEVLIVDDHSADPNTVQVLSHWRKADPRVQVMQNTGRAGAAAARNLGIATATGEWIAFLDADDIWVPGGLQARWQVVQTHPEAEWIGADFMRWHEDGTFAEEGFFKTRSLTHQLLCRAYESGTVLQLLKPVNDFLQMSLGWTSTVVVKKALLLSVGGFETSLGNYEDHHLWIRLARQADFFFVPEVVALYRQHAMSVSREEVPPAHWYIVAMRMLLRDPRFRSHRTLIRRKLAALFAQNAYYHRARGETSLAIAAATHAVLHQPSRMDGWKNLLAAIAKRK